MSTISSRRRSLLTTVFPLAFGIHYMVVTWLSAQTISPIGPSVADFIRRQNVTAEEIARLSKEQGHPTVQSLVEAMKLPREQMSREHRQKIVSALARLRDPQAIKPLLQLFDQENQTVREEAYDVLINTGWKPLTIEDKVMVLLSSPLLSLSGRHTLRLQDFRPPQIVLTYSKILISNVDSPSELERKIQNFMPIPKEPAQANINVVQCVSFGEAAVEPAKKLLHHPDKWVRERACLTIGLLKDEGSIRQLVEVIVENASSREAAAKALAAIGSAGLPVLMELMRSSDTEVAAVAAASIGEIEPSAAFRDRAVAPLIIALGHKQEKVRYSATRSLGSFKTERAADALCLAMRADQVNYCYAATALILIGPKAVKPLTEALNSCLNPNDDDRAMWCSIALGRIGDPKAVEHLSKLALNSWDMTGRALAGAAYGLSQLGHPSVSAILALTTDERPKVRANAVDALTMLHNRTPVTQPEAVVALAARLQDLDETVRARAIKALLLLTGKISVSESLVAFVSANRDGNKMHFAQVVARYYQAWLQEQLSRVLLYGSENHRLEFLSSLSGLAHPFSMHIAVGDTKGLAQALLRLKGIVLDSITEDARVSAASGDTEFKILVQEFVSAKRSIHSSVGDRNGSKEKNDQQRLSLLESQIAQHVAGVGNARRALFTDLVAVQEAIARSAVLLEFVRYAQPTPTGQLETSYGVVLIGSKDLALSNKAAGEPVWVPLGDAQAIEDLIKSYQSAMSGGAKADHGIISALHARLFDPIRRHLAKEVRTLFVSPDAHLNFVNFGTLVTRRGDFLAEAYSIKHLASGRDLVSGRMGQTRSRSLAAFANPAFAEKPAIVGKGVVNGMQQGVPSIDRRDYAGMSLSALPNTGLEAQFLRERSAAWHLEGAVHLGAAASEVAVKAVKSPYILHLATHGFFLPDNLPTNRPPKVAGPLGEPRVPVVFHNPMQRSGLAFAGAQLTLDAWKRGEIPDAENDGILMAQEVGTMDLQDTWLVVLSACDTGIGQATSGEGVLGLRRGFVQAGAQNLLMTLWPISDKWSVDIMKAFYEKAMTSGDAPQAMADVQAEWLAKLRKERGVLIAARIAGPFVLSTRGRQSSK